MMNLKTKITQGFLALLAFALIMGVTGKAQAIVITPNDLVLVLYGNATESYQLIGRTPAVVTAPGTQSFSISGNTLSAAGAAASTSWALVSLNTTTGDFNGDPASVNFTFRGASIPAHVDNDIVFNNLANWSFNASAGSTNPTGTFPKSDVSSFFNQVDAGIGDGRLGVLPAGTSAAGAYGQSLQILTGDFNTGAAIGTARTATLSLLNAADLTAGGTLTIAAPAPVPVPASVVLFATGLVGLIGVARRRMLTI